MNVFVGQGQLCDMRVFRLEGGSRSTERTPFRTNDVKSKVEYAYVSQEMTTVIS